MQTDLENITPTINNKETIINLHLINVIACLVKNYNWQKFAVPTHTERCFDLGSEQDIFFVVRYVENTDNKNNDCLIFHEREALAYPIMAFDIESAANPNATAKLIHENAYSIVAKKRKFKNDF